MKYFPRHIAIEGPIGVGKTTLAKIITVSRGSVPILEEPEKNPFLSDFYEDQDRWGLRTQLSFLIQRHRQLSELSQADLFRRGSVSDYIFEKNDIFASLTLNPRDLKLYRLIADQLRSDIVQPDLVIYLQSTPERLLRNIKIRDNVYERLISRQYLENLINMYNGYFKHWSKTSLLIVNAVDLDFVNNAEHRELIMESISKPVGETRQFVSES